MTWPSPSTMKMSARMVAPFDGLFALLGSSLGCRTAPGLGAAGLAEVYSVPPAGGRRNAMAPKVVIARQLRWVAELVKGFEAAGCRPVLGPEYAPGAAHDFTREEIETYFRDADAFVAGIRERYSRDLLRSAERLGVGCSPIIGTAHIDVEAATELGIVVGFGATPENYLGVAEAIVMLSAALIKRLPQKWAALREGGYRIANVGSMVRGQTIGMIGLGNVGRAVARRLAGWDCRLIAADPYVSRDAVAGLGVEL